MLRSESLLVVCVACEAKLPLAPGRLPSEKGEALPPKVGVLGRMGELPEGIAMRTSALTSSNGLSEFGDPLRRVRVFERERAGEVARYCAGTAGTEGDPCMPPGFGEPSLTVLATPR